jgi:trk/ktr system potassium uptake protein
MFALIAGAGEVGRHVAADLLAEGHTPVLIEKRREILAQLPPELAEGAVEGDASEPAVLERAGVRRADLVVAATGADEDNLVVCFLAKREYQVSRTVARLNQPGNSWMYDKDMGVDVAISQAHLMSQLILAEIEVGALIPLLRFQEGDVSLVEEKIAGSSRAAGRAIGSLAFPGGAVPVAVVRGTKVLVPTAEVVLEAGDRLLALTQASQEQAVAAALR